MDFENDDVCEKIINEIDAVFHKDPDLCGFEIIHLASNQNKNKTPVVHAENNLGLESWCVQHVYEYSHKKILVGNAAKSNLNNCCANLKYLNCAILINPDVATFWNYRRKLFINDKLNITKEFQFSLIVLSKKPKSNEAFFYRRWLYSFQSGESIDWNIELALCERCADKCSSNYHAWCHRQWVLQKSPQLLKHEARLTEKFIRKHIGDYSGYNHRQHVLWKLLETGFCGNEHTLESYADIRKFVTNQTSIEVDSTEQLLQIILPGAEHLHNDPLSLNKIKSLLYCLNLAAYDLQLCADLKDMFGYREAFEYHRKATIKFMIDNCSTISENIFHQTADQPHSKVLKIDDRNFKQLSPFLETVQLNESQLGEWHTKWCRAFLAFNTYDLPHT